MAYVTRPHTHWSTGYDRLHIRTPEDEKLTMGIPNRLCGCQVTSTRSCRLYGSAELISNHTSRSKCYPQIHKGVLELGRVGPWMKSCYESEALSLAVGQRCEHNMKSAQHRLDRAEAHIPFSLSCHSGTISSERLDAGSSLCASNIFVIIHANYLSWT
jgi:hypothetical protein